MIVRTRWAVNPATPGVTELPPEDAPAAEPMARLIVVEVPREKTTLHASPEPAETIDLADCKLLVFRKDLYRGQRWGAKIALSD